MQTQSKKPKSSFAKKLAIFLWIIVGVVFALIIIFSSDEKKNVAEVAGPTKSELLLAKVKNNYAITKQAVAAKVSNPNSLDIHQTNTRYFVSDTSMNLVVCEGTADAVNDFGVEKEFKFSVLHRVNGEEIIVDLVNVSE